MKTNELRIGNWVCWSDEEEIYPVMITGVVGEDTVWVEFQMEDGDTDGTDCGSESIRGIPFDNEWRKKFGFTEAEFGDTYGGYLSPKLQDESHIRIFKREDGFEHITSRPFGRTVKLPFVHTIQNFIYALTGEELTIKENATEA